MGSWVRETFIGTRAGVRCCFSNFLKWKIDILFDNVNSCAQEVHLNSK